MFDLVSAVQLILSFVLGKHYNRRLEQLVNNLIAMYPPHDAPITDLYSFKQSLAKFECADSDAFEIIKQFDAAVDLDFFFRTQYQSHHEIHVEQNATTHPVFFQPFHHYQLRTSLLLAKQFGHSWSGINGIAPLVFMNIQPLSVFKLLLISPDFQQHLRKHYNISDVFSALCTTNIIDLYNELVTNFDFHDLTPHQLFLKQDHIMREYFGDNEPIAATWVNGRIHWLIDTFGNAQFKIYEPAIKSRFTFNTPLIGQLNITSTKDMFTSFKPFSYHSYSLALQCVDAIREPDIFTLQFQENLLDLIDIDSIKDALRSAVALFERSRTKVEHDNAVRRVKRIKATLTEALARVAGHNVGIKMILALHCSSMRRPYTPAPVKALVVDCPWQFGDSLPGNTRGASKQYKTLTVDELCVFKLPVLADNAIMFFWRVASMQSEALQVIKAWGFEVKSELVWIKKTKHGKRHFGMGRYVRMEHETCLICVRGNASNKGKTTSYHVNVHDVHSTFEAPIGRHSEKPDRFYEIVEQLVGDVVKAELFARRTREGWHVFGNQVEHV